MAGRRVSAASSSTKQQPKSNARATPNFVKFPISQDSGEQEWLLDVIKWRCLLRAILKNEQSVVLAIQCCCLMGG